MNISCLNGERILSVNGCEPASYEVIFACESGRKFRMFHQQDCCENVTLQEVVGDSSDLVGLVVDAREESRNATPDEAPESGTWTFYIIQTDRGCVTLRWLGESNGWYSEEVEFEEMQ